MPGKHCVGSVRERTGDTTAVRRTVRRLGRRGGADVKAQSDLFKSSAEPSKVLRPTPHEIGHFGDGLPSVLKNN